MKIVVALFTLAVLKSIESSTLDDHSLDIHWKNFKQTFKKFYSPKEEKYRRAVWQKNVADIIHHNLQYDLGYHSFRKGINEYTDMKHEEFVQTMNGYKMNGKHFNSTVFIPPFNLVLPDAVDWREEGLVTPVKNQGPCAACWPFTTTGTLEGQMKKKTGKLVPLSEQNLIDCAGEGGCEGGFVNQGFEYVIKNGGLDTEKSYPFTGIPGTCHYKPSESGATCTGVVDIPSGDEKALQTAVATVGPIAVVIDASQTSFQLYSDGIYDEPNCSSTLLDHCALVVGYGSADGKDYWIVKNSWGISWGEQGYIRMSRNKNNQCGIASQACYPLV